MASMLSSSTIDRGFEPRSGQAKDYKNGICPLARSINHCYFLIEKKNKKYLVTDGEEVETMYVKS